MHILGYTLRPAEELADFAIVAGGLGVVSGLGGRWFFAAPVVGGTLDPNSSTWGTTAWNYPAFETQGYGGGDWANFVLTLWAMSGLRANHFPSPDFDGTVQTWFANNMPGWDGATAHNYVEGLNQVSTNAAVWGPLGQHAGIILLSVFLGGILARAGLFGARLAAARMPHPPALSL